MTAPWRSLRWTPLVALPLGLVVFLALQVPDGGGKADASHSIFTSLLAANSGKCLAVFPGHQHNGSVAYQWACGTAHNVRVENAGGGWHYIIFTHSNKCLTVNGFAGWNGATLDQWDCVGQTNQKWSGAFVEGAFELHASQVYPNKCITVHQESRLDGAIVNQWDCLGQANQAWRLRGSVQVVTATPTRTATATATATVTATPVPPNITGPTTPDLDEAEAYMVSLGPIQAGQTLVISSNRATDSIMVTSATVGFSITGQGTNSVMLTFTVGGANVSVNFNLTCTPAGNLTLFANRSGVIDSHAATCTAP